MRLGAMSISLSVKDLQASIQFYQTLGFEKFTGVEADNWLVIKNGEHVIGLFQGMFDQNIITFNPGWDNNAQPLGDFTDVRELQWELKSNGIELMTEADETTTAPGSMMMTDPDGNTILIDQHV